ncbi:MAG: UbiA family prenyltransferase [Methyloligella sp. ZOD6]
MIAPRTALTLGRVSNLPTVWSNVLAASVLAGGAPISSIVIIAIAMSFFYVGGMYLNDAFDSRFDTEHQTWRPIPSGRASLTAVTVIGGALLAGGIAILAGYGLAAGLVGAALAATILFYDWYHKGNPLSPVVMGTCRALVYLGTAAALGAALTPMLWPAVALASYVAGLTYAAKQERLMQASTLIPLLLLSAPLVLVLVTVPGAVASWYGAFAVTAVVGAGALGLWLLYRRRAGDVPQAIGLLIAGIALVDGLMAATMGASIAVVACWGLFCLTLLFQRFIPGT